MPYTFEASTMRILNPGGETVGTGFLVSETLAVTCAHVVACAEAVDRDTLQVQFTGRDERIAAQVERLDIGRDVALLHLTVVPDGVSPVRLTSAETCRPGSAFRSFGYAIAADVQGIHANGTIDGCLPNEPGLLQLQSPQINWGMSGAPVFDEKRGAVVGMITKGHVAGRITRDRIELGRNEHTTFATPSETLWRVYPQLKPSPSLPYQRNSIVEGIHRLPYDYAQRIQNFLTEYLGTDAHPVPFGGRDEVLRMLNVWLAGQTPYLLLATPAGRGKSALLVRWLDDLKTRPDLALAFIPVSIRFGTNLEHAFYAALAARLAFLHGDDVPNSPETPTAVYRGLVNHYLAQSLTDKRTLLVVLDGLDEAADWQVGADFMPAALPAGVRVAVSARFLAGDADAISWLRRLNWERSDLASVLALPPLDRAGVANVLLKMGCPLDELSRKVDIVSELYRLSAGDPLLVGLYVGDLWTQGESVTRLKPEDLAGIPPSYKGYFDHWWDDQKKLWGKEKPWLDQHVRSVRSLLAGALGPLSRDDFQALEPELESDYITDTLEVLRRFIIGDPQIQGYTFSHPKLGQYFWEDLTETERTRWERRFLAWGEQMLQEFISGRRDPRKKADVPAYVVRHYGAYLTRAQQPLEKWLELIHHRSWAQAWFTVEGAYGGYAQDVQRVWEQCKISDRRSITSSSSVSHLGAQVRCSLIEASLHSLAGNIPPQLIPILVHEDIWTLPQAWVFIRQMPEAEQQADAVIALLSYLGNEHLPEALEAARAIQDEWKRAEVLSFLAQSLPEVGREALEAVRAIQDEWKRAEVLSILAQSLPEMGGEVLKATRALQDEWRRAEVLGVLAQHLPEGPLGQILEMARGIRDERACGRVLVALAQRLPEVAEEALNVVRAIRDADGRANALSTLVQLMPEIAEEALEAAQTIQDEWVRADVLSNLAWHLPEKLLEPILEAARAVQDEGARTCVLSALTQRLPELTGEALQAAWGIPPYDESCADVLDILAQRLPEGALGQVLEMVRAIQNESSRASALSALAQRLPEVVLEALTDALVIQDEEARAFVLSTLVQYLPEKLLGQVLEMAWAIQNETDRIFVLNALVQRQPTVAGEALETTRSIQDEEDRADALSALAEHIPEGLLGQFLEATQEIQYERDRADILSVLAKRLPERLLGQVLEVVYTIKYKGYRVSALSALAQRQPERLLGQALKAARATPYEGDRVDALSDLAQYLPERLLGRVLKAAWKIEIESARAHVLSTLAQRLPKRFLGQVMEAARAIQGDESRANVLSALAQRIPEVAGEALEAARAIQNEKGRAEVLSDLAQCLPKIAGEALEAARTIQDDENRTDVLSFWAQRMPEVVGEALEAAWVIQNEWMRVRVLRTLVQPLINLPINMCYMAIEATLDHSSLCKRADLFLNISALLPVFLHLSKENMSEEVLSAVCDVSSWWK